MPAQYTYPGIYIEELPSSTNTITAAPTSVTVFVGYTHPFKTKQFQSFGITGSWMTKPIELFSFTDYQRNFGGFFRNEYFDAEAALFGDVAQAVNQFFLNGGAVAWVVGLLPSNTSALPLQQARADWLNFSQSVTQEEAGSFSSAAPYSFPGLTATVGPLSFFPLEPVDSNHQMQVTISNVPTRPGAVNVADVTITYGPPSSSRLAGYGSRAETYRQVSPYPYLTGGAGGTPSTTPGKREPELHRHSNQHRVLAGATS